MSFCSTISISSFSFSFLCFIFPLSSPPHHCGILFSAYVTLNLPAAFSRLFPPLHFLSLSFSFSVQSSTWLISLASSSLSFSRCQLQHHHRQHHHLHHLRNIILTRILLTVVERSSCPAGTASSCPAVQLSGGGLPRAQSSRGPLVRGAVCPLSGSPVVQLSSGRVVQMFSGPVVRQAVRQVVRLSHHPSSGRSVVRWLPAPWSNHTG